MKIVVDTNILFSFFWKDSLTRKILISSGFDFISCKLAIEELKKYSSEIIKKTGQTSEQFNIQLKNLNEFVNFIEKKDYVVYLQEAEKISPDKDDSDFFALCMKNSCFLWSNDSLLKQQNKIRVLSTEDIISILF